MESWTCKVCSRGCAPDVKYCDHGGEPTQPATVIPPQPFVGGANGYWRTNAYGYWEWVPFYVQSIWTTNTGTTTLNGNPIT